MSSAEGRLDRGSAPSMALALLPGFAGLVVAYLLKLVDLEGLDPLAQFIVAGVVVVTGAPILRRSQRGGSRRTASGQAGSATLILVVTVGAGLFWLIDVAASVFALGLLSAFGSGFADLETFFFWQALIALPIVVVGAVLATAWFARRSTSAAERGLNPAVVLYVLVTILANMFVWAGDRALAPGDVVFPIITGAAVWFGCRWSLHRAGRAQDGRGTAR